MDARQRHREGGVGRVGLQALLQVPQRVIDSALLEVQGDQRLARCLVAMGAEIEGIGTLSNPIRDEG